MWMDVNGWVHFISLLGPNLPIALAWGFPFLFAFPCQDTWMGHHAWIVVWIVRFLSSCLKRRTWLHEFALSFLAFQWSRTVAICSWFNTLSCPVISHGKPTNDQPNSALPRIAIFGGRGLPKRRGTKPQKLWRATHFCIFLHFCTVLNCVRLIADFWKRAWSMNIADPKPSLDLWFKGSCATW